MWFVLAAREYLYHVSDSRGGQRLLFRIESVKIKDKLHIISSYLLPTTYTPYHLPPATYYLVCLLPTTYYLLPTTYYLPPSTYYRYPLMGIPS